MHSKQAQELQNLLTPFSRGPMLSVLIDTLSEITTCSTTYVQGILYLSIPRSDFFKFHSSPGNNLEKYHIHVDIQSCSHLTQSSRKVIFRLNEKKIHQKYESLEIL